MGNLSVPGQKRYKSIIINRSIPNVQMATYLQSIALYKLRNTKL